MDRKLEIMKKRRIIKKENKEAPAHTRGDDVGDHATTPTIAQQQKGLLDLIGKLEWDASFDYKAERRRLPKL